jgi:hypothetical protein
MYMMVMSKVTKLSSRDVIDRARKFFDRKYGLTMLESDPSCCAHFVSDIGFVTVRVVSAGNLNEAILETREWEYQIQEFLKKL